jgi:uncharacterized protein YbjT (DUF2867 family)
MPENNLKTFIMKIVIIGGTGLIGSQLADKLRQLEQTVIAASPASGVNTITGEGLEEALNGTDVVVDVSNSPSFEDKAVMDFFTTATTNLLAAATSASVSHYVALSVVGVDRLPGSGYLRAKLVQEDLIRGAGIPYSILRSTQFFEFADRIAQSATIGSEIHVSTGAIQPIASEETVAALSDIVIHPPLNRFVEVGGPERMPMSEFIRYYVTTTEDARQVIPDVHALYFGVQLDDTALVTGENARLGKIKYEDWLPRQVIKV